LKIRQASEPFEERLSKPRLNNFDPASGGIFFSVRKKIFHGFHISDRISSGK
jgi:hypothetical protein